MNQSNSSACICETTLGKAGQEDAHKVLSWRKVTDQVVLIVVFKEMCLEEFQGVKSATE